MDLPDPIDSLQDAHAQAMRRIQELREREAAPQSPPPPDLRTLLARAETHVSDLRGTAQELAALLPTRVEAAVARALGEDEGGLGRRLDQLRAEMFETARAVDRIERDLLAERLGRVEDLEVLVDLLTGGLGTIRADVARLEEAVAGLATRIDAPLHVTIERTSRPLQSLFARTEPRPGPEERTEEAEGSGTPSAGEAPERSEGTGWMLDEPATS